MNQRVIFSRAALETIFRHTREAGKLETGGALAGIQRGELTFVIAASGPGPGDRASEVEFELLDTAHHEAFVREVESAEPSAALLGPWHKHPSFYRRPSDLDLVQGHRFIDTYSLCPGVLMPITFNDGGKLSLQAFFLPRGADDVVVLPWESVDHEAGVPWVRTAKGRVSVARFRRAIERLGYLTQVTAGSSHEEVGVEICHPERNTHVLLLVSDDPFRPVQPAALRLSAPGSRPGAFVAGEPEVSFHPLERWGRLFQRLVEGAGEREVAPCAS